MASPCSLCERTVPATTEHHLLPRSEGRRQGIRPTELPTTQVCPDCHRQLHALYSNRDLATRLTTVEALRRDPPMERFLAWVKKRPPETLARVRR